MPPQPQKDWYEFENFVASIYRKLGVHKVQQNISLGGNQIDIYVEDQTISGQLIRTAVECKFYKSAVGISIVRQFALTSDFLKRAGLIDTSVIVGYMGFSKEAYIAAKGFGIELISFKDLEEKLLKISGGNILSKIDEQVKKLSQPTLFDKTVFVMMPFDEELSDLYFYGIRGSAEKLGLKCVRADEIMHNSEILKEIKDYITKAEILIGVMTKPNLNVYYEVGFAHGVGKKVLLLTEDATNIPFDLRPINHIIYTSIKDVESQLTKRLATIIHS